MHPPPPSSIHLHPAHFNLHPAPPSSFQPPPSSLQHLQQYLNQNIARNWAISPNLGQKIKSCPFWLKIGTHGILEVLIPNPDLDFWNSDPKIHFWANLGPKIQSCPFCLKIGTHGISKTLILIPTLVLWIQILISILGKFGLKKSRLSVLNENWHTWYLGSADSESGLRFLKFRPQNSFLDKFVSKKSKLSIFPENWHAWHLDNTDSYSNISFLNFQP